MRQFRRVVVWALCCPASVAMAQDENGFLQDTHLSLNMRNFYSEQTAHDGSSFSFVKDGGHQQATRRTSWVQAAMLDLRSGYTQGAVQFGLDVSLYGATLLERGRGSVAGGGDRVLVDNDGEPVGEWGRLAIADVRLRVSHTELKVGRMSVDNPMLKPKDNRALPSTFQGASLVSADLPGITTQAGWFTEVVGRTGSSADRFFTTYGNRAYSANSLSYLGFDTHPWHGVSLAAYVSRLADIWDRSYLGLTHTVTANAWSLRSRLALYSTHDQGSRQLGYLDNRIASLGETLRHGPHQLTLAYQQVFGNEYFDYPLDTAANYTPIQFYSDFNGPNEHAASVYYGQDLAYLGIPGLTAGGWYARGWNIDGSQYDGYRDGAHYGYGVRTLDGARHWEVGLTAGYTLQSGTLKGSSLRATWFHHREEGGQIDGNYDELRLVTTLLFTLF